jgi:hypothetical protein
MDSFCSDHSGCQAEIANLKHENKVQWGRIDAMATKIDNIHTKFSQILASIIILCLGIIANFIYIAIKL